MQNRLKELERKIFGKDLTDEGWIQLKEQVDEAWNDASEKERQEFMDSGAGDMLGQIIEFMD